MDVLTVCSLISAYDYKVMRLLLISIPEFGRYSLNKHAQTNLKHNHYSVKTTKNMVAYTLCDKLHRDNDLPAVIKMDGSEEWWQNGKRHRDNDLPAVVDADGSKQWCQNGERHRDNDLPAVVYADGSKRWYQNGKLHRDNDLPAIVRADGSKEWWQNGERVK